jgi:branched-chain amino acid transport system permease protein
MAGRTNQLVARIAITAVVLAGLLYVPQYFGSTQTQLWAQAIYYSVAAIGLNLLTGYNGQVSIGHGAFFGLGAYTTAILMEHNGWQFLPTLPVVVVVALIAGAAFGFPALRLKGLYLALITLGLAALFPDLVNRFASKYGTGGTSLIQPPRVLAPEWADAFTDFDDQYRYYMALIIGAIMLGLAANLVRGRFGRSLIAVRDHEAAASILGVDVARVKVGTFAISAAYAAVAGALSVLVEGSANAGKVEVFQQSILFLVAIVIGGTATVIGPVVGSFLVVFGQDFAKDLIDDKPELAPAVFGIVLVLTMYVLPDGIVGGLRRLGARLRRPGPPPVRPDALTPRTTS